MQYILHCNCLLRCQGLSFIVIATACRELLSRMTQLSSSSRNEATATMLRQLPHLFAEDRGFRQFLSETAFVAVPSGSLKAPQALYDPT